MSDNMVSMMNNDNNTEQNELDKIKLGKAILALRLDSGLSQQSVADVLGTTRRSIYNWETGYSAPSAIKLVNMLELYGVIPSGFIDSIGTFDPVPSSGSIRDYALSAYESEIDSLRTEIDERHAHEDALAKQVIELGGEPVGTDNIMWDDKSISEIERNAETRRESDAGDWL